MSYVSSVVGQEQSFLPLIGDIMIASALTLTFDLFPFWNILFFSERITLNIMTKLKKYHDYSDSDALLTKPQMDQRKNFQQEKKEEGIIISLQCADIIKW